MPEPLREPFELITPNNEYAAKLVVPTRSDGATIDKSGWEVGGDTITRTTSKGNIEEEPYEDIVSKLIIHQDHIEMGVLMETGKLVIKKVATGGRDGSKRTIRIRMEDITDVRTEMIGGQKTAFGDKIREKEGIVFETADDVYQLVIYRQRDTDGILDRVFGGAITIEDGKAREQAVEKIEENKDTTISDDSNSGSIADELEQIKDLHEKDVLTDEEFKEAKNKLLE